MKLTSRVYLSTFIASLYVGINIFVMKIGGDLAGGIHYDSHTWEELKTEIPKFITFFIVVFVGTFVYSALSKEKNLICPKCENSFVTYKNITDSICPICSSVGELAEGFYERHTEFKNKKVQ
jgi:hypothetical protein